MVEADEPEGSSWCVGLQPLWLCEHDVEWWMIRGVGMDVVEWWSMLMLILRNTRHHGLGGEFNNHPRWKWDIGSDNLPSTSKESFVSMTSVRIAVQQCQLHPRYPAWPIREVGEPTPRRRGRCPNLDDIPHMSLPRHGPTLHISVTFNSQTQEDGLSSRKSLPEYILRRKTKQKVQMIIRPYHRDRLVMVSECLPPSGLLGSIGVLSLYTTANTIPPLDCN
jgi:hypothetical protein